MNKQQIQKMFIKLDEIKDTNIKRKVFYNLGENCYKCRNIDKFIGTFGNDILKMIDWISTNKSPYWEKLELVKSINPITPVLHYSNTPKRVFTEAAAGTKRNPDKLYVYRTFCQGPLCKQIKAKLE